MSQDKAKEGVCPRCGAIGHRLNYGMLCDSAHELVRARGMTVTVKCKCGVSFSEYFAAMFAGQIVMGDCTESGQPETLLPWGPEPNNEEGS